MKALTIILLTMLTQISIGQTLVEREVFYQEPTTESSQTTNVEEQSPTPRNHQTLLSGPNAFGGYLGFSNGFGVYNDKIGYVTSGRLMFVANHYLGIGFGGKAFVTTPEENIYNGNDPDITEIYTMQSGGYGGLYLEPVLQSMKPIHLSFPILLGMGGVARTQWDNTMLEDDYYDGSDYDYDNITGGFFLIVEPGAELEFNITKWLRLGAGAYYRFTSEVEGFNSDDAFPMDGFSYELSVKVGWF